MFCAQPVTKVVKPAAKTEIDLRLRFVACDLRAARVVVTRGTQRSVASRCTRRWRLADVVQPIPRLEVGCVSADTYFGFSWIVRLGRGRFAACRRCEGRVARAPPSCAAVTRDSTSVRRPLPHHTRSPLPHAAALSVRSCRPQPPPHWPIAPPRGCSRVLLACLHSPFAWRLTRLGRGAGAGSCCSCVSAGRSERTRAHPVLVT